jgi:hypothetical protein
LTGKFVLQDLRVVLAGGTVVPDNEVTVQPYDFFKEIQPVKGKFMIMLSLYEALE